MSTDAAPQIRTTTDTLVGWIRDSKAGDRIEISHSTYRQVSLALRVACELGRGRRWVRRRVDGKHYLECLRVPKGGAF